MPTHRGSLRKYVAKAVKTWQKKWKNIETTMNIWTNYICFLKMVFSVFSHVLSHKMWFNWSVCLSKSSKSVEPHQNWTSLSAMAGSIYYAWIYIYSIIIITVTVNYCYSIIIIYMYNIRIYIYIMIYYLICFNILSNILFNILFNIVFNILFNILYLCVWEAHLRFVSSWFNQSDPLEDVLSATGLGV